MTHLYLSRLLLNPRSRQVQREITDPYNRHRTIMAAFPDDLPDRERVLHRLDTHPRTERPMLLVQSHTRPDWSFLQQKDYLLPPDPFAGLENPAVKPFHPTLQPGQACHFRLRANPTVKKKRDGRKNGTRVPLVRPEKQLAWLERKADRNGFRLIQTAVTGEQERRGRKRRGGPPLTIYTVQFEGQLQIVDAEAFTAALTDGIGPAKAFGCGLLSLAPA